LDAVHFWPNYVLMTTRSPEVLTPDNPQAADWLTGGGEMGKLIRSTDWSKTPLGPIESWPQSLRSAVSILLPSRAQIAMFWGPDLITLYNDAYSPVFGKKHPRALGLPIREAWSELWDNGLKELFEGVLVTGEAFWASDRPFYMERYGFPEETFFDISYDPIRDETGKVGGLFCIVNDTTTRVVSERRLRTLRDLSLSATVEAKSVKDACRAVSELLSGNLHDLPFTLIYLLTRSGKNAELVGTSGLVAGSPAAPISVDISTSNKESSAWPFNDVLQSNRAAEITDLVPRFGALPGGVWPESPHSAMVIPISASGQERAAGFLVAGVSPRRPLDDQYRAFFDLLTTQIATTVANARAYEEERRRAEALAELDRAKTTFFSNVSHEFRTPLTLMLGPVADLLAEIDGSLPESQRERLEIAHRNGLRLQKLVNTLLDFSRIEAGRVQASYEPTDLATLTADLASNFRSACEKAGLELVVDCSPLAESIYVDQDMWEKIVLNLISNAFKFTFSGRIEVSLKQIEDQIELAVRDTGVGIPPDELPKLFERFHRVEVSRGRTQEGSGIGLALVRELVKLHSGSVRVDSTLGQGSTFTVSLPRGKDHLPADRISAERTMASTALGAAPFVGEALRWLPDSTDFVPDRETDAIEDGSAEIKRPRERLGGKRFRILLADDNADMRDYVRHLLGERYEVQTVADGQAAWNAVQKQVPDLILSDVMMPMLNGFELLRRVRADPRSREVPVIMLSARAGEESRIEGLEATADDYLIKPFSARELLARIDAHLRIAEIRHESRDALRVSEERYRQLVGLLPVAVYTCDAPSGVITFYNQRAAELWGRAPRLGETDVRFCGSFRLWHNDGTPLPHDQTPMALAVREGQTFRNQEVVIERPDGSSISVLVNVDPILDADGRIIGAINAFQDTTTLKSTQEELRQREEHLRAVVETTPACIKIVAADGTVLDMNSAGLEMLGADSLDLVKGKSVYDLISEQDRDTFRGFHQRICEGEKGSLEFEIVGLNGRRRRIETHAVPLRGPDGKLRQLAITHDITERKRAEELLRQSATQLSLIADTAPVFIAHCDREHRYLFVNKPYAERFGLTPAECIGKYVPEVVGEAAYESFRQYVETALSGQAVEFEAEVPYPTIGTHFMHCSYVPEFDEAGHVVGWVAAITDISQRRIAEEALRASEERYRQIFEQSIDGVFVATQEGRYVDVSPSGCEMLGMTREEVLNSTFEDVLLPEELERIPAAIAEYADGEVHQTEWRFRRKDGSVFVGEVSGRALPDGRLQGIVRDITERKRAEEALRESEQQLASELEAMNRLHALSIRMMSAGDLSTALEDVLENAIAACGSVFGIIQLYNEQSAGLEIVTQIGMPQEFLDYFKFERIGDGSACAQAMKQGRRIMIEDVETDPDFAPHRAIAAATGFRAVQSTPLKTHEGQILGMLSTHFRAPHRLSDRDQRLLDLYARHAADLIERFRFEHALKESDRRKDEFLATLAHELRNPLAPIRNGLELIRLGKSDTATLNQATTIMHRQVEQMVRLVDDLLDVARISRNKLELRKESVELEDVIQSAVETSRPLIESARHKLQISMPANSVILEADPVRLAQAFSNLLNNAAKYSQPGSRISLTAEHDDGELVVRVRDNGIGIDADKLPQIFEMFMQADPSKERAQGGLGIGLTLVQRLVEMHDGTIQAQSEGIGKGSEFVIRLPVAASKPAPSLVPEGDKQPAEEKFRRRVLVVDDNVDSAESMAMMLKLSGHEVALAHDGLEAIEVAKQFQPEVAFLDLGMPKLNGYEAARSIRQLPQGEQITLVALTGWGQEEDKRRTREAGFNAHIVKPIDFAMLEQLVADATSGNPVDT